MTDPELDPYVEWIAREAKRAIVVDSMAVERVMARVRQDHRPRSRVLAWRAIVEPCVLPLSPIVSAALAAGLVGVGIFLGSFVFDRGGHPTGRPPAVAEKNSPRSPLSDSGRVIKFVLIAPRASTVSVVGDFNNWDARATPMTRTPTGATWS